MLYDWKAPSPEDKIANGIANFVQWNIAMEEIWLVLYSILFYFYFFSKGGKTHQTQMTNQQWGQPSLAAIRNCRFVRITVIKENHATWNNPLVVRKGAGYHSWQMPLGLGPLTCFLTSEEDELLAKQKQFYGILQADFIQFFIQSYILKYIILHK